MPPARVPQDAGYGDRRKERDDRRRSQAQGTNVVPPSPALVRHGSKQRKIPTVLTPGQPPPQAYIPIGIDSRENMQHPYAQAAQHTPPYGPVSTMASPRVAVSNVRAMGGEAGISQNFYGQEDDFGNDRTKPSFLRILTCRC